MDSEARTGFALFKQAGLIIVLLIVLLGGYFYSKGASRETEKKMNVMSADLAQLREQNDALNNHENALKEEIDKLKNEMATLKTANKGLQTLNQSLQNEKTELMEDLANVRAKLEAVSPADDVNLDNITSESLLPSSESATVTPDTNVDNLSPQSKTTKPIKSVMPAQTIQSDNATKLATLYCPSVDAVNEHLANGYWKEGELTWWIGYSTRPLNNEEKVKGFFKAMLENNTTQAVSCYYRIGDNGNNDSTQSWVMVRTNAPKNQVIRSNEEDWKDCENSNSCQSLCTGTAVSECGFEFQKHSLH